MDAAEEEAWKEITDLQEKVVSAITDTLSPIDEYPAFSQLLGKRKGNTEEIKDPFSQEYDGEKFLGGGYRTKARLYIERYMKKYTREKYLEVDPDKDWVWGYGGCNFTKAEMNTQPLVIKLKESVIKKLGLPVQVGSIVSQDISVAEGVELLKGEEVVITKGAILRKESHTKSNNYKLSFEVGEGRENFVFGENEEIYCSKAAPDLVWLSIPYGITHGLLQTDGSPYKVNDDGIGTTEVNVDITTTTCTQEGCCPCNSAKGGRRRRKKTVKRRKTKRTKKRKTKRTKKRKTKRTKKRKTKRRKKKKRKSNRRK